MKPVPQEGHMNVMWYVGKFDEATWNLFAHVGLDSSALRVLGSVMVAVEQRLQYKKELFAGDVVRIDAQARKRNAGKPRTRGTLERRPSCHPIQSSSFPPPARRWAASRAN
jgi:thioesterase superfamily protein